MSFPACIAALTLAFGPVDSDVADSPPLPTSVEAADAEQQLPATPAIALPEAPVESPPPVISAAPFSVENIDGGEISVTAVRHRAPPGDPLEQVNEKSFEITQSVDRAIVRPVAKGYQRILPDPVRSGIRNLINNLREPVAFINFMLQHKVGKAAETVGRFAINTTIGVGGLFDIAKRKPFHLPRRPNGLANTFGFYGVKPGAFLFLPLVGPTTVRDLIGDGIDRLFLPLVVGDPFNRPLVGIGIGIASSLDQRAEFDEKLEVLHTDSDPYAATREDYLRHRQAAIDALHVKRRKATKPAPANPAIVDPAPAAVSPDR